MDASSRPTTASAVMGGAAEPPTLSLPKAGGAVRGIGETFTTNPTTGTASASIPIVTSAARGSLEPGLALTYESGVGNGPFGLGWTLSLPAITRRTDRRLPEYRDGHGDANDSDTFVYLGADDLVAVRNAAGGIVEQVRDGYRVRRYRPRIEGTYLRIERWTNVADARDVTWQVVSGTNTTTWFGRDPDSRISDPDDPTRIFSWSISTVVDDRGNAMLYTYIGEDGAGVAREEPTEEHRDRRATRYLRSIFYGNRKSVLDGDGRPGDPRSIPATGWLYQVLLDYDEGRVVPARPAADPPAEPADDRDYVLAGPGLDAGHPWTARLDPFSSYRSGFELRTHRLCRQVLVLHRIPEELGRPATLVRSTDLEYEHGPTLSLLGRATQSGYRLAATAEQPDRYLRASLPPLDLGYTRADGPAALRPVAAVTTSAGESAAPPWGEAGYRFVDLDGDGAAGLLAQHGGAWSYARNLSPLEADTAAAFGAPQVLRTRPSASLADPATRFLDVTGSGRLDVAVLAPDGAGFYERADDESWHPWRAFGSWPVAGPAEPSTVLLDLDGDGLADLLRADEGGFVFHPSLGAAGYGPAQRAPWSRDDDGSPRLVIAEEQESIYFADMTGDGLLDVVRIRSGEISYWPNLGYGRFGRRVPMGSPPALDRPDRVDPARIRLGDVDGNGLTDLVYLGAAGVLLVRNQAGNAWAAPELLPQLPPVTGEATVDLIDLLGSGTACLVWSSPDRAAGPQRLLYVDLTGSKPFLLSGIDNNLGSRTRIEYRSSAHYALLDRRDGRPWPTRLPFPVQVVAAVETYDAVTDQRYRTEYAYHDGHYDPVDREYRGFGMVEHRDSAEQSVLAQGEPARNLDPAFAVPPALTRSWYHLGAVSATPAMRARAARDYYREGDASLGGNGPDGPLLDDDVLPSDLLGPDGRQPCSPTAQEVAEAHRALAGALLREETYALDGTERADRPYRLSERRYQVELLQQRGAGPHAVLAAHPLEQLDLDYERVLVEVQGRLVADPRMSHVVTLDVDAFGNVLRTLAVGYRRRDLTGTNPPVAELVEQRQTHLQLRVARAANLADRDDVLRLGLPVETREFEIVGGPEPVLGADGAVQPFALATLNDLADTLFPRAATQPPPASLWPTEKWDWRGDPQAADGTRLRLTSHHRVLYRRDDLTGPLSLGAVEPGGLPYESYALTLTPGLLDTIYRSEPAGAPLLADLAPLTGRGEDDCGYVEQDGGWWAPAGRVHYSRDADPDAPATTAAAELAHARAHFFRSCLYVDGFGHRTVVESDGLDLLVTAVEDGVGNRWQARHDYRVLAPVELTDPNGNQQLAVYDALGVVAASALAGKPVGGGGVGGGDPDGDDLSGVDPDPTTAALQALAADPVAAAPALLGGATTRTVRDVHRFHRCGQPPLVVTLGRTVHASAAGAAGAPVQITLSFSDGFGNPVQTKVRAEAGDAPRRAAAVLLPTGDRAPGALDRGADGQAVNAPASPRWACTGRTLYNNKAKPVCRHEAFFSATPLFEAEPELVETGRSAVLIYDPLARVVATLHADGTYEKVVFDTWRQVSHDANDTVTDDPRTDPDIGDIVAGYAATLPPTWQTWYQQRQAAGASEADQDAATKAAAHAHTPTTVDADALGRAIRTTVHNRVDRGAGPVEELAATRHVLDGAGAPRRVYDVFGRLVAVHDYDLQGQCVGTGGAESGRRRQLLDAAGNRVRDWDGRGHARREAYDGLRRPVRRYLRGSAPAAPAQEILVEQTIYGDDPATGLTPAQAVQLNLRTHVWRQRDAAAEITNAGQDPTTGAWQAYDLAGRRLRSVRRLVHDHRSDPDWGAAQPPALASPEATVARFDAAGRVTWLEAPDGTAVVPQYNEAGLLEALAVQHPGAAGPTPYVTDLEYDPKGRRLSVSHANGVVTGYTYDDVTRRLARLRSTRPAVADATASAIFATSTVVQDLQYTYDATGNVTRIVDAAPVTVFHDNQQVRPVSDYTYDALYQLVRAAGREHIAQTAVVAAPVAGRRRDHPFVGDEAPHPYDLTALRSYVELYTYDAVGNLGQVQHQATGGSWTRQYDYQEESRLAPGELGNRLTRSRLGPLTETYGYTDTAGVDGEGCLTAINGTAMVWDHEHRLRRVDLGGGGVVYYTYDSGGNRVRAVIENGGVVAAERIYGLGIERYREFSGGGGVPVVQLERTTLHVLDGGQRVALAETVTVSGGQPVAAAAPVVRFQLGDRLGSGVVELDPQARLLTYEEYHPFGTTAFQAGPTAAEVSRKRYRFTGEERDVETGLARHGARYYAPWLGRWTSPDPGGLADGINVYAYAHNKPVTTADPTGYGGWEEVTTEEKGARYYYNQEKGVAVRRSTAGTEVWREVDTNTYEGVVTFMAPETYTHPTAKSVKKDLTDMPPQDFQEKYGVTSMQYDELAKAILPPPEPLVVPEDKNIYMGEGGRVGTAEQLEEAELADRLQNVRPPTLTGSLYGVAAVVLGADAKEASRMMAIGDQLDGMVMAAAHVGAGTALLNRNRPNGNKPPTGDVPPAPPPPPPGGQGGWQGNRLHLPVVEPNFTHDDPDTIFMNFAARTSDRLRNNPQLIDRYLKPSESRFGSYGPWARRIVFGNAVERAMAHGAAPTGLLQHTGDLRPAPLGGPDLVGLPGSPLAGRAIQVTSYRGYETHVENAPPDTIWALYPPLD